MSNSDFNRLYIEYNILLEECKFWKKRIENTEKLDDYHDKDQFLTELKEALQHTFETSQRIRGKMRHEIKKRHE